jgi:hypothetical protein
MLSTFVQNPSLMLPVGLAFGPQGDLFVASFNGDKILRVDHSNGTIVGDFVTAGSGGLDGPQFLTFVPEPAISGVIILIAVRRITRRPIAAGRSIRA